MIDLACFHYTTVVIFSGECLITMQTATSRPTMKTRDKRTRPADIVCRNFSHNASYIRSYGLEYNCGNQGLHLGRKQYVPLSYKALTVVESCSVTAKRKPVGTVSNFIL